MKTRARTVIRQAPDGDDERWCFKSSQRRRLYLGSGRWQDAASGPFRGSAEHSVVGSVRQPWRSSLLGAQRLNSHKAQDHRHVSTKTSRNWIPAQRVETWTSAMVPGTARVTAASARQKRRDHQRWTRSGSSYREPRRVPAMRRTARRPLQSHRMTASRSSVTKVHSHAEPGPHPLTAARKGRKEGREARHDDACGQQHQQRDRQQLGQIQRTAINRREQQRPQGVGFTSPRSCDQCRACPTAQSQPTARPTWSGRWRRATEERNEKSSTMIAETASSRDQLTGSPPTRTSSSSRATGRAG